MNRTPIRRSMCSIRAMESKALLVVGEMSYSALICCLSVRGRAALLRSTRDATMSGKARAMWLVW